MNKYPIPGADVDAEPTPESLAPLDNDVVTNESLPVAPEAVPKPVDVVEAQLVAPEVSAGRLKTAYAAGMTALKMTTLAVGVGPFSGPIRYGAFFATLGATKDPLLAAGVLGGSTLAMEASTVVAGAKWVADDKIGQVIDGIDARMQNASVLERWPRLRKYLSPKHWLDGRHISPAIEIAAALELGTIAVLEAKQREHRDRTAQQNMRHGLFTAGWLGGALTLQGALIGEGVVNYDSPYTWAVGAAALGATGVQMAVKKLRGHKKSAQEATLTREFDEDDARPRYDLTKEELGVLEGSLMASIKERHAEPGIFAVLVRPTHKYANIARHYEAQYFPEVAEVSPEVEENTLFMMLADTREDIDRVVHAATITGINDEEHQSADPEHTGFASIDDLIDEENFTADDFRRYYEERGLDLSKCFAVETNFRVGSRVPKWNGMSPVSLAYVKLFDLFMRGNPEPGHAAIFANINRLSKISLARNGVHAEPLMGRNDLVTSDARRGKQYTPVLLPFDVGAQKLFLSSASVKIEEERF